MQFFIGHVFFHFYFCIGAVNKRRERPVSLRRLALASKFYRGGWGSVVIGNTLGFGEDSNILEKNSKVVIMFGIMFVITLVFVFLLVI